ncbi:MAG: hypothetical protein K8F62_17850 [Pseudorhodoplanes sp.]|nr:hypothetical protein [Pseudorhodoplanes sp.]
MKTIRAHDDDGNLVAAGYEWGEPDVARMLVAMAVFVAGLLATLFGLDLLKTNILGIPPLAVGLATFWIAGKLYLHRFRPRSLVFEADGKMSAPRRLPGFWRPFYEISGHHDQVAAIGVVQDDRDDGKGKEHKTAIYFRSGKIVRVTNPVHQDDAHKVAVQLTAALEALRAAQADPRYIHAA